MATRQSFRPRPLDLSKQLAIVRDLEELDPTDGVTTKDVNQPIEERAAAASKKKHGAEIPIPEVNVVPSYNRDYLPSFREPDTYIRGRGGIGHRDEKFVEYDMDSEDEEWLAKFNAGQDRLPCRRFEILIWRLEVANADATDRAFAAAGAGLGERQSVAAVATVDNMSREEALRALARSHALRETVRAAVYDYWKAKRLRRGKPLLRRLQAPTASSDSNPFNVFRPRDKIHRPQTRRRRENNEDSLDKMKMIRQNLVKAYEILEWVTRREQRKTHIVYVETDLQQLKLKQRHEPRNQQEAIRAEYEKHTKTRPLRRPLGFESASRPAYDPAAASTVTEPTNLNRFNKRRRKDARKAPAVPIRDLPPPPLPTPPDMLFTETPDLARLTSNAAASHLALLGQPQSFRARIGRGGRLVLDRCQPFTYDPLDASQEGALPDQGNDSVQADGQTGSQTPSQPIVKREPASMPNGGLPEGLHTSGSSAALNGMSKHAGPGQSPMEAAWGRPLGDAPGGAQSPAAEGMTAALEGMSVSAGGQGEEGAVASPRQGTQAMPAETEPATRPWGSAAEMRPAEGAAEPAAGRATGSDGPYGGLQPMAHSDDALTAAQSQGPAQPARHLGMGLLQEPIHAQHMQAAVHAAGLAPALTATFSLPDRPQEPLKGMVEPV